MTPDWCVDPDEHGARGAVCICPTPEPTPPVEPVREAAQPVAVEGLREALVNGMAYALARAALPMGDDTSRDYAEELAPLVIESGYLALASPPSERATGAVDDYKRGYKHGYEAAKKEDPRSMLRATGAVDRCDKIINNGMGEPTECGRTLPCEYHATGAVDVERLALAVHDSTWACPTGQVVSNWCDPRRGELFHVSQARSIAAEYARLSGESES